MEWNFSCRETPIDIRKKNNRLRRNKKLPDKKGKRTTTTHKDADSAKLPTHSNTQGVEVWGFRPENI